jgi:dihydroorotate dehydrogenase (NAD+) catalytic subunit
VQTAAAAIDGGAQILSLVNTFTAMSIDIHKRRPRLANVTGGLSGPAIKPIALHLVSRVYRNVARSANVPLIGMGGIQNWVDAAEFILAGASAISIGTALFIDPATPNKLLEGLRGYMVANNISRLSDLVGALQLPSDEPRKSPYP